MSLRYPNANYPVPYDEDDMVVGGDVPVNNAALNLTVTAAGAGQGPLMVTGGDVPDGSPQPEPAPEPEPEPDAEPDEGNGDSGEDDQ